MLLFHNATLLNLTSEFDAASTCCPSTHTLCSHATDEDIAKFGASVKNEKLFVGDRSAAKTIHALNAHAETTEYLRTFHQQYYRSSIDSDAGTGISIVVCPVSSDQPVHVNYEARVFFQSD